MCNASAIEHKDIINLAVFATCVFCSGSGRLGTWWKRGDGAFI
jgi:hypothetical protein